MSFHVGQLVVCIKVGAWLGGYGDEIDPMRGIVYTVRTIEIDQNAETCIRLVEIINSLRRYTTVRGVELAEIQYSETHFRPVRDESIEVFRRIAASPKERIRIGEDA